MEYCDTGIYAFSTRKVYWNDNMNVNFYSVIIAIIIASAAIIAGTIHGKLRSYKIYGKFFKGKSFIINGKKCIVTGNKWNRLILSDGYTVDITIDIETAIIIFMES